MDLIFSIILFIISVTMLIIKKKKKAKTSIINLLWLCSICSFIYILLSLFVLAAG